MTMASPNNFNFPYFPPPPPPPHVHPPPAPLPPAPSPDNHIVIVLVFVSCGGLFLLAFLAVALFCFLKKKKKKTVQETGFAHVDEHLKVKEATVPGPHGPHAVILEIEDYVHIDENIAKTERIKQGSNVHSVEENSKALEAGAASTSSGLQHLQEHRA